MRLGAAPGAVRLLRRDDVLRGSGRRRGSTGRDATAAAAAAPPPGRGAGGRRVRGASFVGRGATAEVRGTADATPMALATLPPRREGGMTTGRAGAWPRSRAMRPALAVVRGNACLRGRTRPPRCLGTCAVASADSNGVARPPPRAASASAADATDCRGPDAAAAVAAVAAAAVVVAAVVVAACARSACATMARGGCTGTASTPRTFARRMAAAAAAVGASPGMGIAVASPQPLPTPIDSGNGDVTGDVTDDAGSSMPGLWRTRLTSGGLCGFKWLGTASRCAKPKSTSTPVLASASYRKFRGFTSRWTMFSCSSRANAVSSAFMYAPMSSMLMCGSWSCHNQCGHVSTAQPVAPCSDSAPAYPKVVMPHVWQNQDRREAAPVVLQ